MSSTHTPEAWPPLAHSDWVTTYETLHRWTQIVGKVKLALSPPLPEWWHVALLLNARGLTTGNVPAAGASAGTVFEARFDFVAHALEILVADGRTKIFPLTAISVAEFYRRFLRALGELGIEVAIDPKPQEIEDTTPCDVDELHCSYDPAAANRCFRAFVQIERVLQKFRARFAGKSSPIQFYWGGFDLSYVRYSGKPFVGDRGRGRLMRVTNDEQHWAAGFWPGNAKFPKPVFYAYAAPSPADYPQSRVRPAGARWESALFGEFMLDYDAVRTAKSPDDELIAFLDSTYAPAADLGAWDRAFLERKVD